MVRYSKNAPLVDRLRYWSERESKLVGGYEVGIFVSNYGQPGPQRFKADLAEAVEVLSSQGSGKAALDYLEMLQDERLMGKMRMDPDD